MRLCGLYPCFYFSKDSFVILLKFGVYCHCFDSLGVNYRN
jgi:hypothetical protein